MSPVSTVVEEDVDEDSPEEGERREGADGSEAETDGSEADTADRSLDEIIDAYTR